jgi:hypothetical protein
VSVEAVRPSAGLVIGRVRRTPARSVRPVLVSALVALGGLIVGEASLSLLPVRVTIDVAGTTATARIEGSQHTVTLSGIGPGGHIRFEQPGPAEREYQIDGSDTTSRNDRDPAQFRPDQQGFAYRILAWLRDESSYSRWDDVRLVDLADGKSVAESRAAAQASPLPSAFRIEAALHRPEAPAQIWLDAADGSAQVGLSIEPDGHRVRWLTGADADEAASWFFPLDAGPFAAEILQFVGRSAAAAMALLALMAGLALGVRRARRWTAQALPPAWVSAGIVLALWLTAALWIAVRVYHQLPHIVDAEAYAFEGRILQTGRTWLHTPDTVRLLDGFQQVVWDDRWFSQYPPGAPALYAAGGLVGLAWLVGPLAGLALVGATGLTGRLLFGQSVGLAALGLAALSPFVLFQSGSFMSHPIAGAAVACSLAAFAYGWRTARSGWFAVVGILLGIAFDTREIAAMLYAGPFCIWLLAHRRWRAVAVMATAALPFLALYLLFNLSTTGDLFTLPRNVFNNTDHWGFGVVGSYGLHTLAAGLINTDENLTLLQFDLFGWPPLTALALVGLPFLLGRAGRWDYLLGACASAFAVAYVGYFYHGIALGPRYYFEAVPALVLLAARGLQACVQTLGWLGIDRRAAISGACALVALLGTYTLGYYLPHEIDRRMDYGALNNGRRLVLPFVETTLTGPHLARVQAPALVLVPNDDVFKSLSALNCPLLDREHIGDCPILLLRTGVGSLPMLETEFPGRAAWIIEAHGDLTTLQRVRR